MAATGKLFALCSLLLTTAMLVVNCYGSQEKKVHIVYMGDKPSGLLSASLMHHSMLQDVMGSYLSAKKSLVYSYGRSFNGFAAKLTAEQVKKLSEMKGVISVIPNHKFKHHTTRSWDFMGLTENKVGNLHQQGNVIIGLLDTGIWPESESFCDIGLSQPLKKIDAQPDLTAPGVDILAAWSPIASPTGSQLDTRSVKFNVISGTSMSCPHASGAAAYVKASNPDWSPAVNQYTAYVVDPKKHEEVEFAYGSGHINPLKATTPGLVYDANEADFVNFLCNQGYNTTVVRLVTGDKSSCSSSKLGKAWDLNYPSFSLAIEDGKQIYGVFKRTVTNVGSPSTYKATVYSPGIVNIKVEPQVLTFSSIGEKKTFTVTVTGPKVAQLPITSGAILWKDGTHVVRSPLVLYTILSSFPNSPNNMQQKKQTFTGSSVSPKNGMRGHD